MFRILKNVVRVNSTEKEILLGVEFTFTLCEIFVKNIDCLATKKTPIYMDQYILQ